MNREILFRGKRTDNGGWAEGNYTCDPDLDLHFIEGFDYYASKGELEREYLQQVVDPETVGQYIGIPDKNEKKIFEGDILQVFYSDLVGRDSDLILLLDDMTSFQTMYRVDTANEIEVIGNIHDNPELLKRRRTL